MKQVILNMKNILIFGGAGFLGSHLCEELVKNNKIICVDNFVSSSVENIRFLMQLPNFRFIKHDIAQPLILENCLELKDFKIEFQGIQEIYNLACPTSAKNFDNYIIDFCDFQIKFSFHINVDCTILHQFFCHLKKISKISA